MDARGLEYQAAVGTCALLGTMLVEHDLPGMLNAIERADSIGCMIDPTLYRDKVEAMHQDKDLLEAALPLYRWAKKQKALAEEKAKAAAPPAQVQP